MADTWREKAAGDLSDTRDDENDLDHTLHPPADSGPLEPELREEALEVERIRLRLEAAKLDLERARVEKEKAEVEATKPRAQQAERGPFCESCRRFGERFDHPSRGRIWVCPECWTPLAEPRPTPPRPVPQPAARPEFNWNAACLWAALLAVAFVVAITVRWYRPWEAKQHQQNVLSDMKAAMAVATLADSWPKPRREILEALQKQDRPKVEHLLKVLGAMVNDMERDLKPIGAGVPEVRRKLDLVVAAHRAEFKALCSLRDGMVYEDQAEAERGLRELNAALDAQKAAQREMGKARRD